MTAGNAEKFCMRLPFFAAGTAAIHNAGADAGAP